MAVIKKEVVPPIQGVSHITRFNQAGEPMTSEYMKNVRAQDFEKRFRICQRDGLSKWSETQIGSAFQPVVCILSVSTVK